MNVTVIPMEQSKKPYVFPINVRGKQSVEFDVVMILINRWLNLLKECIF